MPGHVFGNRRLIALFLLGCALFNFPLLTLFSGDVLLLGIPLLVFYLYISWLLVIILAFVAAWGLS